LKGYRTARLKADIRGTGDNRKDLELVRVLTALNLRVMEGKGKSAAPVANARIVITQEGRTVQSGSSDSAGNQKLSLPPGIYRIEDTRAGFARARTDVTLAAEDVRRSIVLTRVSARTSLKLRVVVRLKKGDRTIAGAQVVISQKGKRVGGGKTDDNGRLA